MEKNQPKQDSTNISPRKQHQPATDNNNVINNNNCTTNDRLKRDEWSEGAVSCLLEAYEAKWSLRNRAKLKGQDWEDVAKHVSARANNSKSSKTQTQCKNKIESMKKRYRSESAARDASSWPLYPRLDLLLRGNGPPPATAAPLMQVVANQPPVLVVMETSLPPPAPPLPPPAPPPPSAAQNSHGSNGVDRLAMGDGNNSGPKLSDQESDRNMINDTESSTQAVYMEKEKSNSLRAPHLKIESEFRMNKPMKRTREEHWEIGKSIRWVAQEVMRLEEARMETMKEIERMRVEAQEKRGEVDLKRTQIIANTQLEIAKLFAKESIDSSLRIGRS